ncbi:MAG: S-methyl-5'-thioadenosine phosphorylase [Hyphomicrobiales bacterium]|jgi:5'-methylthioadenosine phosphorylase|nr:S-methyl-5'-thioadenosine phosphorylase [Hyphomicrobiales bacterium]
MTKAVLGILGGSGVYDLPGLSDVTEHAVSTPWGEPSDMLRKGRLGDTDVVFLARHGRGHRHSPSDINYRANIDAMKRMGVSDLVALSACGSLKAELYPGLLVMVDQYVDRTHRRESSFFGAGCVAHVSMAHPVGPLLQGRLMQAAKDEDVPAAKGGTYVCIEGPQFSSYAESQTYRGLGYDVIGMTGMPEAKLAREAEITFATVAMVTDFDCWHSEHDAVDVQAVIATVRANAANAARLIARLARDLPASHESCPVKSDRALDGAIMTAPAMRDPALLARLDAVAGRVLA